MIISVNFFFGSQFQDDGSTVADADPLSSILDQDVSGNYLSLMPRLHLPSDEFTIPVQCPNHPFRAANACRPCDHRTDSRAP